MEKNVCTWLKINQPICGRTCRGSFCYEHNHLIRRGKTPPHSCGECGLGTRLSCGICSLCGGDKIMMKTLHRPKYIQSLKQNLP